MIVQLRSPSQRGYEEVKYHLQDPSDELRVFAELGKDVELLVVLPGVSVETTTSSFAADLANKGISRREICGVWRKKQIPAAV